MAAYMLATDPSGLYYGSNASGLVNVASDNINVNNTATADTVTCNNLNVKGTTTVTTITETYVTNPILDIATGNTASDSIYTGLLMQYAPSGSAPKLAGLLRNPGTGEFMLLKNGTGNAMTGATGATLVLDQVHTNSINVSGQVNTGTVVATGAGDFSSLSTAYTSGTNSVLGSATVGVLSATTIHTATSTVDDGSGSLFNTEVNTVSLNVSGTSNLEEIKLFGSLYAYPSVPFSTQNIEGIVPSLQIDSFGVETLELVAEGISVTANPIDLIPLVGNIPVSYGAPYVRISALGNIVAHGVGFSNPVFTGGGNIAATGTIKGGANCSFGNTTFSGAVVVSAGGIVSGAWTLENDGNTLFGTAGGGVVGVGSDTKIYGRIQFGDVTQGKDKVTMYNPVDIHGPITTGPRSIAFNGPLPDLLTF